MFDEKETPRELLLRTKGYVPEDCPDTWEEVKAEIRQLKISDDLPKWLEMMPLESGPFKQKDVVIRGRLSVPQTFLN